MRWYWQGIRRPVGGASYCINKCKCWLSFTQRELESYSCASFDYLPRFREHTFLFQIMCQQIINKSLEDLERVHLLSSATKTTTVLLYSSTFSFSLICSFYLSFFEAIVFTSRRDFLNEGGNWDGYLMAPRKAAHFRQRLIIGVDTQVVLVGTQISHCCTTCISLMRFLCFYI